LLNKFKSDVTHATDMGDLLAMKKKLQKQLLQGSSLSLVTVDNMNQGLLYLNDIIEEREEEQRKAAGVKKAAGFGRHRLCLRAVLHLTLRDMVLDIVNLSMWKTALLLQ